MWLCPCEHAIVYCVCALIISQVLALAGISQLVAPQYRWVPAVHCALYLLHGLQEMCDLHEGPPWHRTPPAAMVAARTSDPKTKKV